MSEVEDLAEIFMDVSKGKESTTEQQQEQRGSWRPTVNGDGEANIHETITEMRNRYGHQTTLSDEQLIRLVQSYFDGAGDTEIARRIGDPSLDKTVTRARLGLHLFRESDTQADFDVEALRECLETEASGAECARRIGIGKSTANRYRRIFDAKAETERVDHEYHDRFQQYCRDEDTDADLEPDYFADDGLDDAVADAGADNPQLQ